MIEKNLKIKWNNWKNNLWGWVKVKKRKGMKQGKNFQNKNR